MDQGKRCLCFLIRGGLSILLLSACQPNNTPLLSKIPEAIDSFDVHGIRSGHEVQEFHYLNDSMLLSYNTTEPTITYYYRTPGSHSYNPCERLEIDVEPLSSMFEGDDHRYYFVSRSKRLYGYDSCFRHKVLDVRFRHHFDYLKDSFLIVSTSNYPVIKKNDTFILPYAYDNIGLYEDYFKEPSIAEFRLENDSLHFLKNYASKPNHLREHYFPFSSHCLVNNTLFLLYPSYDTIYTYNRSTGLAGKVSLHNKDFQVPGVWDIKKVGKPDYNSYQTRYELNNFSYECIYFDETTRHFIVFYKAPVSAVPNNRLPTYKDQKRKALILNEQLEVIDYLTFPKNFVMPGSYFFIPGKGLAMPVFKSKTNYETTRFYTYHL